jgi:hypothetical protein
VKTASEDPQILDIADRIKQSGKMQAIIQRVQAKELTGEGAIEEIDRAISEACIVLQGDTKELARYKHAVDETSRAHQCLVDSKQRVQDLEAKKKAADDRLEELHNEQVELTNPEIDEALAATVASEDSCSAGHSMFSGLEVATDLKPPPRKRRATDGLNG